MGGDARAGPGAADDGVRYGQGEMNAKSSKILFVASLSAEANERDLNRLFTDNGFNCAEVSMPVDRYTEKHRGYGFVELEDARDIDDACNKMNGVDLKGRAIKVEQKKPREAARPRPGGRERSPRRDGGRYDRNDSRRRTRRDSRRRESRRQDSRRRR